MDSNLTLEESPMSPEESLTAQRKVWQPGGKSDSPEEHIFPRFPWLQKPFTCYTFFKKNQIALKTFFLRVARTIIPAKYFFSNRTEFQTEKVWFVWRNFFLKNWFFFFLLKLMLKLCLYLQISQICAKKLRIRLICVLKRFWN